jgi:hypothetical protein
LPSGAGILRTECLIAGDCGREIEYQLVKLERSATRREGLVTAGGISKERRDEIADELAYYRRLHPIEAASSKRQSDLRDRLLPGHPPAARKSAGPSISCRESSRD